MGRRNFVQVLESAGIDIKREYSRLLTMFYEDDSFFGSVASEVAEKFNKIPFVGTCISLDDFDETYGFLFEKNPRNFDLDYLVTFCEYCYNFCMYTGHRRIVEQVERILEKINYQITTIDGKWIFTEKSAAVTSVTEIVSPHVATRILEYNHHTLKGNIAQKQKILKDMADYIEPLEPNLAGIDNTLKKHLFYLFNNFNIRHNNIADGSDHNVLLDDMEPNELEKVYDDTYQLWLLAILQLDNVERKRRIHDYRIKQDQKKAE